nr:protein 84 [synthetic construct]
MKRQQARVMEANNGSASSAVIISNWVCFLCLTGSFLGLLIFSLKYKGPDGKEVYYNGYREQNMLGVFINLWCAVAYFAKVIQAHGGDDVAFAPLTTVKYIDYITTCPLLTMDLLWNLDAPYKITSGLLVLTCLTFAVASFLTPKPGAYVWFAVGLSFFTFSYTFILSIVRQRLDFFTECAREIAHVKNCGKAKTSILYLKVALFSYFGIWIFFPVLWILGERGIQIISDDLNHVLHCILDVIAKSCYGYALLYFRVYFDKKLITSGMNEEEFTKLSKDIVTHSDEV